MTRPKAISTNPVIPCHEKNVLMIIPMKVVSTYPSVPPKASKSAYPAIPKPQLSINHHMEPRIDLFFNSSELYHVMVPSFGQMYA